MRTALIEAFVAGDSQVAASFIATDATFNSPVRSYRGVDRIEPLWAAIDGILTEIRLVGLLDGSGETAGFFEGQIGGEAIDGVLRVKGGEDSPADDVTLMLRPYGPMKAAIAEMGRRLNS
ncbi:MAG TPA: nuclear transport factor 2 family protein [Aeromicrobium sp.]|nr:nuclear transport factor 2 family protein [Aeromicrobium sp.]